MLPVSVVDRVVLSYNRSAADRVLNRLNVAFGKTEVIVVQRTETDVQRQRGTVILVRVDPCRVLRNGSAPSVDVLLILVATQLHHLTVDLDLIGRVWIRVSR